MSPQDVSGGPVGRFAVDFVACRDGHGAWMVYGVEINLRKGRTTHTYGVTRLLRGGRYDVEKGVYRSDAGRYTCYGATDNLVHQSWVGRPAVEVRERVAAAGLAFDRQSANGVVLHLLDCLRIDGRMGYTAIADTASEVADLEQRLLAALSL